MSENNFDKYSEYNRILRSWFVAFGIGGPVIFLVNDAVRHKLASSGEMKLVVILFIIGAAAQVIISFINKVINWYLYRGKDEGFKNTSRYKSSKIISNWFWLDIFADVVTFIVFGIAVWKVFTAFVE